MEDLESRFEKIRTEETNTANMIADIARVLMEADIAIINSGTLRADTVIPKGPLTLKTIFSLLPYNDCVTKIEANAEQLVKALENGVSQYPALEGRFPLVRIWSSRI